MQTGKARKKKPTKAQRLRILRRNILLPYLATAILIAPLAVIRSWPTRVEMHLLVEEIGFDFHRSASGGLIDSRQYESIALASLFSADIRPLTGSAKEPHLRFRATPDSTAIQIVPATLSELQVEPQARVSLVRHDQKLTVAISRSPTRVRLSIPSGATLHCRYCDEVQGDYFSSVFQNAATAVFDGTEDRMVVSLGTFEDSPLIISKHLFIGAPSVLSGSPDAPVSGLVDAGTVTIDGSAPIRIAPDEIVTTGGEQDLRITSVMLTPTAIDVTITGVVKQLRIGRPEALAECLPTLLSRIHSHQTLPLYFGAVAFVAGTIFRTMKELRYVETS